MKTRFLNIPPAQRTALRKQAREQLDKQHPTPQQFTYYELIDRYVANVNDQEFIVMHGEMQYWWYRKNSEQVVILHVDEPWAKEIVDQLMRRV